MTYKISDYISYKSMKTIIFSLFLFALSPAIMAQDEQRNFWSKVRFGGGLGLNFGNGFTSITVAPSAIYDVDEFFSVGPGLIYSYQKIDNFKSSLYGGSVIALVNPIREIQISAELEQLRVNQRNELVVGSIENNFWNTALFLGAGYRASGVTIGIRYNVLFQDDDGVYADAWSPFVRVYF
ncbi:MAG: hypothetical protein HKN48_02035 [Flavobacteriaceae bacterium]|nr:hypothetical protein [Flavobacteriaceae bacterium]